MEKGPEAFVLFYAFFWAAAFSVTGRYHAFDTASVCKRDRRAICRLIVAFIILNFLPVVWFIFLYREVIPDQKGWWPMTSAAIASLSVFGFLRIFHAFVATEKRYHRFYTDCQVKEVQERDRERFIQPQTFWAHLVPGLLYLLIFGGVPWLVTWW